MKPINYVLLWIGESFIYIILLIILYLLVPEVTVYSFISNYTGVIQGDNWDKYYFLALCILAMFFNAALIFFSALLCKTKSIKRHS